MLYVDKTDLIKDLIQTASFVFLSRPRRFGKSLLLTTLSALFEDGVSAFAGLKIENDWHEETYRVLHLDFSALNFFDSAASFEKALGVRIWAELIKTGFNVSLEEFERNPYARWLQFLSTQKRDSIVLLIDEYDSPLSSNLNNPELFEAVRKSLSIFFAYIKNFSGIFRFVFITGILKFRQASLFSSFNNMLDISMDSRFGTLLGYTESELKQYFSEHIESACAALELTAEELLAQMKETYDGFCFDGKNHVFAPWSVLSFFGNPGAGFKHYWFESAGTPGVLLNYLKSHGMLSPAEFDSTISIDASNLTSADHINEIQPAALLTHAGYLTIRRMESDTAFLGYPNAEVRDAMAKLYSTAFWPLYDDRRYLATRFVEAIERADIDELIRVLNGIVHHLDYDHFSLTNEAAVRQLVQVFCLGAGLPTHIEVHSPRGRSDLEISTPSVDVVFEFKYAQKSSQSERKREEAEDQIIERDYGNLSAFYLDGSRKLLRVAAVFAADERKFTSLSVF